MRGRNRLAVEADNESECPRDVDRGHSALVFPGPPVLDLSHALPNVAAMGCDDPPGVSVRLRRVKNVVTVAIVLTLLSPLVRAGDGVPLSSYSMYATPRQEVLEFVVPTGVTSDGDRRLSTQTIAATRDPLIAETLLRREVAEGRAAQLCDQILARVTNPAITRVELRVERYDVVDRALGAEAPIETTVITSCSP